jgi:hypothetical protein
VTLANGFAAAAKIALNGIAVVIAMLAASRPSFQPKRNPKTNDAAP